MASHAETKDERDQDRKALRVFRSLEGGLARDLALQGTTLRGFSVRISGEDVLLTLRGLREGSKEIAFVGGETVTGVLLKAGREGKAGTLRWRADKFA